MDRSRFSLPLILILTSAALSQSPARPPVPIEPLLRNNDPRLVALGAWEMVRRQDDTFLPILQQMVEHWDPAQRHRNDDADQFDAMTVILDVLIQRNAVVSLAGVTAIAYAFPDQALILAARLPPDEGAPLLCSWYMDALALNRAHVDAEGANRLMMSRVAATMLAKKHPQLIAASLLADSVERLAVSVPSEGESGVDRCLVGCEDKPLCVETTADVPQPGWPHVFQYHVEEYNAHKTNPNPQLSNILIEASGDFITYRRVEEGVDANYCHSPTPLDAQARHQLLSAMLGVKDKQMPWAVQMNLTLPWQNDQQFLGELSEQVDAEETRLRATVQEFFAKGLLTRTELDATRPKLSITLFDDRKPTEPPNPPLPQLEVKDSRTTCRISPRR